MCVPVFSVLVLELLYEFLSALCSLCECVWVQVLEARVATLRAEQVRLQKMIVLATPALGGLKARTTPVVSAPPVAAAAPASAVPAAGTAAPTPAALAATSAAPTAVPAAAPAASAPKLSAKAALAAAVAAGVKSGAGVKALAVNRLPGSAEVEDTLSSGLNIRKKEE